MKYQEGDLLLCKVEKIDGTTVFVSLPDGQKGTIITSEIASGRIRNLRKFVVPNKKIVCKVLRVLGEHLDLSLRRVSSKEKKEIMQKYKQEQTLKSALKSILKQDAEKIQQKILKNFETLSEFVEQVKKNKKLIPKYIPKSAQQQIEKLIQKKQKQIQVKKSFELKCYQQNGIETIKKILTIKNENTKIHYISAGNFQIILKNDNYKKANQKISAILNQIEATAKEQNCEFELNQK